MPPDSAAISVDPRIPDDGREFCRRHDLPGHLGRAVELARQHFSIVGEPSVRLEQDPEDGEWCLDLDIRGRGEDHEVIEAKTRYTRSRALSIPWPAVHLMTLIRDRSIGDNGSDRQAAGGEGRWACPRAV